MSISKDQIIEAVATMSVTDVKELVSAMEKKFGVSASVMTVSGRNAASDGIPEEQTEFDVVLTSIGANKIAVIKAVRSAVSLGLKESKDLVESAPVTIKEALNKQDSNALKKTLEEAGATVEVK